MSDNGPSWDDYKVMRSEEKHVESHVLLGQNEGSTSSLQLVHRFWQSNRDCNALPPN